MKSPDLADSKEDKESFPKYCFAGIEVGGPRRNVCLEGREAHIRIKSFEVLLYLIERRDRLVTKDEVLNGLWKYTEVSENSLVQCIIEIRRTLGDDARNPRFIKTIPKVGYQFIGLIESTSPPAAEPEAESTPDLPEVPSTARTYLSLVLTLAALAILGVTALAWRLSRGPEIVLPHVAGKHSVAVLYFENQSGNKDLEWLRQGLADMLIARLSQSRDVSVLGRLELGSLFDRLAISRDNPIRWEDAVRVANKSHAEMAILGSFARLGEKIRIGAEVHDPKSGRVLAAESVTADGQEQILPQVDVLSRLLAGRLGMAFGAAEIRSSLAGAMTNNLEAYRCYSLALERGDSLYAKEAITLYKQAISLDPGFAMAYARIGYTYSNVWGQPLEARPYLAKAFALSDRLTPKERMVIAAWYTTANFDYEGAIRAFRQLVTAYPQEPEWYRSLASLLRGEHRFGEAVTVIRQAIALDPENPENYNHLASLYAFLNRHPESIRAANRYVALSGGSANSYDSLGTAFHLAGQYPEAERAFLRAIAIKPDFEIPFIHLATLHFEVGQRRKAVDDCRRYVEVSPSDAERDRGRYSLAVIYWERRDLANLRRVEPHGLAMAIEDSNFARARRLLDAPSSISARGLRMSSRSLYYWLGRIALAEHRNEEAIAALRKAVAENLPLGSLSLHEDCLADGLLAVGRLDEALAEYRRVLTLFPKNGMVHYHLATALDRQGKRDLANAEFRNFLTLWKDADPDIPEMLAAKKRVG